MQVKCFTCGEVLGNKHRYFLHQVELRKAAKIRNRIARTLAQSAEHMQTISLLETQTDQLNWADRTVYLEPSHDFAQMTEEDQILNELELTSICCRTAILTQLEDNNF